MKNKKGFTLIEIIICISLIVIIGSGSFISIRLMNKKLLIDKLNQITDKATLAAQTYIETNKNASNQLYNNKNGVSLPLQLLVNEGLLDLKGTNLTESDIRNQYVTTFLGSTGSSDNCEQITSATSWSNNQPVYLCLNSSENSNKETTLFNENSNKLKSILNDIYYFKGQNPDNYIEFDGNMFTCNFTANHIRIISINKDDSLTITFGTTMRNRKSATASENICNTKDNSITSNVVEREDILNTGGIEWQFYISDGYKIPYTNWLGRLSTEGDTRGRHHEVIEHCVPSDDDEYCISAVYYYTKMTLPNTCKLDSGTGTEDNKYVLKC